MRYLLAFPVTVLPLAVYIALAGTTDWNAVVYSTRMLSGSLFQLTAGQALVGFSIAMLFVEVVKATRTGFAPIVDHVLSTVVALAYIVLFIVHAPAATGVFALLMLTALADLVAGFWISLNVARRDVAISPGGSF
ncbi:MAG: hypothetical protein KDI98_09830 [Hyphomicrobiaceae bacterium]|nr:hypothetical protein [Hyphomicrobiaceae bacterium]